MKERKKILALCGSTKKNSTNLHLINAIQNAAEADLDISIYKGLAELPHFNPDLDTDTPPQTVVQFRRMIEDAAGILICTPEYAMGVPGTLKNALDWTVSSCEFSNKPVALITASLSGEKGHAALLETLKVIECVIPDTSQLLIQFAKTKVSDDGKIIHAETSIRVHAVIDSLQKLMNEAKD